MIWAAVGLLPALLVGVVASGCGNLPRRWVAVEFATSLSIGLLVILSFAFDQSSSLDLALTLALLSLPAGLVFAVFVERWL